ncbi:MAG TPA: VRR-NUC domain-containing protein [Nitrososphaera sp.]|nr:VRR-NUC domain-containing protein [Nitrososphaera sp.]
MDKLRKLAFERRQVTRKTDNGEIRIEGLKIHFPPATLLQIKNSRVLDILEDKAYLSKPVLVHDGRVIFGELAILRYLEKDQWKGVWVDSFHSHGRTDVLWSGMPPTGVPPALPPKASEKFQAIKEQNGGRLSGFFDVFAWKEGGERDDFIFIEYKGRGDPASENESEWISAALAAGVKPEQLCIVGYDLPT